MIKEQVEEQGMVVIEDFSLGQELPKTKLEYYPLTHRWSRAELEPITIEEVTFDAELIELQAGDYSIIHKFENKKGIVGFCYLDDWDFKNGGYLGINYEATFPKQNELILYKEPIQWSIKKLNHHEKKTLRILVLRNTA